MMVLFCQAMKSVRILEHRAMRKNVVAMTVTLTGERSVSVLLGLF